jgi:hypothetical protein
MHEENKKGAASKAGPFPLPEPVRQGWTWEGALQAMKDAGFEVVALRFGSKRDWSGRWGDCDGPVPDPVDPAKGRWFAILWRADGFLATMDSTQGGFPRDKMKARSVGARWDKEEFDSLFQELNSMNLFARIDCGSKNPGTAPSEARVDWRGDGTWLVEGDANAVTGGHDVNRLMKKWLAMGKPIALERWDHSAAPWLDPGHFTDAPLSGSAADFDSGLSAFRQRVERDLKELLAGLPAPVAKVLELQRVLSKELPAPRESRGAWSWNEYASQNLLAQGKKKPDASEREMLLRWGRQVELAERGADPKADWSERALGANFLHALARSEMCRGSPKARPAWWGGMDKALVARLADEVDPQGSTPSGWAFRERLSQGDTWGQPALSGVVGWLAELGAVGRPGEWVSMACGELEGFKSSKRSVPQRGGSWDKTALSLLSELRGRWPEGWAGEVAAEREAHLDRLAKAAAGLNVGDWAAAQKEALALGSALHVDPAVAARSPRL